MARWSPGKDREFHDELFGAQAYDPFSRSYPGYLTIRRFADHAERHFHGARTVVDLGCGPGEITCELARRRPDVHFAGIDHSEAAIAAARSHAARLTLANVAFEVGDLERYRPSEPVDLILMFDAFHHVLDPTALLARLRPACPRIFLIEPSGTWLGGWDRRTDLDWLPATVRQIRERLEHQFGLTMAEAALGAGPIRRGEAAVTPAHHPDRSEPSGEPTEHRYTLTDFERLFAGSALEVRGTLAGLETYGLTPHAQSPLGDRLGDISYELVVKLEDALYEEGLDLGLKHWAILATPAEGTSGQVRPARRRVPPARSVPEPILPPYGVEYRRYDGPPAVRPGEAFHARLELVNTGWVPWDSRADRPVLLSYHWLNHHGRTVVQDGLRTPLSRVVGPGESVEAVLRAQAPDRAGRFTLAVDLVHEGAAWFSDEGVPPRREAVRVSR